MGLGPRKESLRLNLKEKEFLLIMDMQGLQLSYHGTTGEREDQCSLSEAVTEGTDSDEEGEHGKIQSKIWNMCSMNSRNHSHSHRGFAVQHRSFLRPFVGVMYNTEQSLADPATSSSHSQPFDPTIDRASRVSVGACVGISEFHGL